MEESHGNDLFKLLQASRRWKCTGLLEYFIYKPSSLSYHSKKSKDLCANVTAAGMLLIFYINVRRKRVNSKHIITNISFKEYIAHDTLTPLLNSFNSVITLVLLNI
uniref:Uncharacterized protein n=1 Tax=Glossina austeni TaxID=7395 RepID=A0A1A9VHU5_GLOAU